MKKIFYSITKFEKYPEMSAEGIWSAIKYIILLIAIFSFIVSIGITYQTYSYVIQTVEYINEKLPEINYKDGVLDVKSEQVINDDTEIAKIIIDTKNKDDETVYKYIDSISVNENGIILLKDKAIMKSMLSDEASTVDYETLLKSYNINITEFNKQDIINYVQSSEFLNIYFAYFGSMFIYTFLIYLISALADALILALLGYLTSLFVKLKIRLVAIYNMAIYSLTLPITLNAIYIIINLFTGFTIEYFQVMYVSIAYIYLIAAIFMIKSDLIKKQQELIEIEKEQENVRKEIKEDKQKDNEENEDKKEKNNKDREEKSNKKQKNESDGGEAAQGSNA